MSGAPDPWMPGDALDGIVDRMTYPASGSPALYLLDIDGSRAVRVAGDPSFPDALEHGIGVGKDIPVESAPVIEALLHALRPGAKVALLVARGRGVGFLAGDGEEPALESAAAEIAPWLELASGFTDELLRARLRRSINTEGMIQQNLLPPEIGCFAEIEVAGSVLPAYDVGGDWFDHAINSTSAWLGVGDGVGKGIEAASLAVVSIGAFRASRVNGCSLAECAQEMNRAILAAAPENSFLTCVIARCDIPKKELGYVVCGHPLPVITRRDGSWSELEADVSPPLGLFPSEYLPEVATAPLATGDQVLLYTDGVVERRDGDGNRVGVEHLVSSLSDAARASPAFAVASVQNAVLRASPEPLRDDSTLMAFRLRD